ncbi:MAG: response regulator [Candidatus Omnitrophica bacterium]|nr:response regulator [Candidatus Omnitrophota bacterium]
MENEKILIVDDEQPVREYLERTLKHLGYEIAGCIDNADTALDILKKGDIALLLTDLHMPGKSGMYLLNKLKGLNINASAIVLTASQNLEDAISALNLGADRYILKPMRIEEIAHTVKSVLEKRRLVMENMEYQEHLETKVLLRTKELRKTMDALNASKDYIKRSYIESIQRLTVVAEYKDEQTGSHLRRIGLYVKLMAEELGLSSEETEILYISSPMHDLGKISIPDRVLLKPGPLTPEEFEIVKQHTVIGANILKDSDSEFLKTAQKIAVSHHEKWNGAGYPRGLKKDEIPLESRITAIADQYDAIRSRRPYKEAISHADTCKILLEGDAKSSPDQFDPHILETFKKCREKFNRIYESVR